MPKMITKYGVEQEVEVKTKRGEWIPGKIAGGLAYQIYQVQTAEGFLTVREGDIRLPGSGTNGNV